MSLIQRKTFLPLLIFSLFCILIISLALTSFEFKIFSTSSFLSKFNSKNNHLTNTQSYFSSTFSENGKSYDYKNFDKEKDLESLKDLKEMDERMVMKQDKLERSIAELNYQMKYLRQSVEAFLPKVDPCVEDPLDDCCNKTLQGFPEPLTPVTARLCDRAINADLPHNSEFKCDSDPTCLKCKQKDVRLNEKLSAGFHEKSIETSRRERILANFEDKSQPVIVCAVNFGQLYLFLNWACSCIANNVFDPRKHVYILPSDQKTFEVLDRFKFVAEPLHWLTHINKTFRSKSQQSRHVNLTLESEIKQQFEEEFSISSEYTGAANTGGHALINNLLAFTANFVIKLDYPVLLMDVDLIFLNNPFPYLIHASRRRDVLGMLSPRDDTYGKMNSGFIYYRNSRKAKVLLQSLENLSWIKHTSDQQLWNTILRHYQMQHIEQRILPRDLFFTLWRSTTKYGYNENRTFLLHTVSVDKAPRLKDIGKWYFTDKCQFFDAGANDVAKKHNLLDWQKDPNEKL